MKLKEKMEFYIKYRFTTLLYFINLFLTLLLAAVIIIGPMFHIRKDCYLSATPVAEELPEYSSARTAKFEGQMRKLKSDVWPELSKTERMSVLQAVADHACNELGIENVNLYADDYILGSHHVAYWDKMRTVSLSEFLIMKDYPGASDGVISELLHGVFHAYESDCVMALNSVPEEERRLDIYKAAVKWSRSLQKLEDNDYTKYYDSALESSAKAYAEDNYMRYLYYSLECYLQDGTAVISEPVTIKQHNCRFVVYDSFIALISDDSYAERECLTVWTFTIPENRFEDINAALASIEVSSIDISNGLDEADISDGLDEVSFTDRGVKYTYREVYDEKLGGFVYKLVEPDETE